MGSAAASQLQGPQFDPELRLLFEELYMLPCLSGFHLGSLVSFQHPQNMDFQLLRRECVIDALR